MILSFIYDIRSFDLNKWTTFNESLIVYYSTFLLFLDLESSSQFSEDFFSLSYIPFIYLGMPYKKTTAKLSSDQFDFSLLLYFNLSHILSPFRQGYQRQY